MSFQSEDEIERDREEEEQELSDRIDQEQAAIQKAKEAGWTNIRWNAHRRAWLGTDMFGNPDTVLRI